MKIILTLLTSLFINLLLAQHVVAEPTLWVTDKLSITMRTGKSNQHKIVRFLTSGTAVSVLSEDQETGYSFVRSGNAEGWVVSQYLSDDKPPRQQLAAAQATIQSLTDNSSPLAERLAKMEANFNKQSEVVASLRNSNRALTDELKNIKEVAGGAIHLNQQNKILIEKNQMLQSDVDLLRAENERLADNTKIEWFINGVFAVAFGVFIALFIPRLMPKKRHTEWR